MGTLQREIVEATIGNWPTAQPTDGYMRSALDVLGVHTRGQAMTSADLLRLCRANGLDFSEATDDNETNRR